MAGPAHFILYVDDQVTATAFWTAVLGRSPSLDVPGMTEFTLTPGTVLGLMPEASIRALLAEGRLTGLAEGRTVSAPVVAAGRRGGVAGSGPGGPVLARGRFYWASLRVARWVANRCVRVLLCVAPRCSPSVSLLVTPHSCWSAEVPGLHGMQEVRGSNPRSSTDHSMNSKT